ncbi:MAG TPA: putative 4-mercaptohistidine N1-methyltransferase [Verrucomicrobiae bacterium]|jgi:putative 4-mercaptohistidine N1-methyltranferase|nr:putative 4-mercaptohistidine N1-methyltransferase [Verrucomicrobiae bacterium]
MSAAAQGNYYETDRAVAEYLLFHYGEPGQIAPPDFALAAAGSFPARCISECLDPSRLPPRASALDLGCAVGRATFEMARHCQSVLGIDWSERFITIGKHLRKNGSFLFGCVDEGDLTHPCQAVVPAEIDRLRIRFERGDAMDLPESLRDFDVVLMANLIDRLRDPRRCLERLPALVKPGGQLIITSPYTWMTEYTPKKNWLGGFEQRGKRHRTLDALKQLLAPEFQFQRAKEIPFLIREHARKFQLGVAEASVWIRQE